MSISASPVTAVSTRAAAHLVFMLALLLYLPSVWNDFAYDDNAVIRFDERIHDPGAVVRVFVQPYWQNPDYGLYRPLASMSYAVDWSLSQGRPAWFHFVNVVWNAGVCVLVFAFLAVFVPTGAALAGALLFAAHPVHVEAVANIVGRAELMAAFFALAALLVWLRSDPDRPLPAAKMAAVAALFTLALLAKENAIMLPALLALADSARGMLTPATARAWLHRHAGVLALLAGTAIIYLLVRSAVLGGVAPPVVDPLLDVADSTPQRVLTALQAWPVILRLLLYPRVLLADYGPPTMMPALELTAEAAAGALALALLVVTGLVAWARGAGRLAFVLLFLPVALLPTSNLLIPTGVIVAERMLYLPSLAVAAAVAFTLGREWPQRQRRVLLGLAVVVICAFGVRTLLRIPEWHSTTAIMAALERDRPDSYRAHWYHAQLAVNMEEPARALGHFAAALRIWPFRERLVVEAAAYAGQVGDVAFAEQVSAFGLGRWPDNVDLLRLSAAIHLDRGDTTAAHAAIRRGLALAPADSTLRAMLRATMGPSR